MMTHEKKEASQYCKKKESFSCRWIPSLGRIWKRCTAAISSITCARVVLFFHMAHCSQTCFKWKQIHQQQELGIHPAQDLT